MVGLFLSNLFTPENNENALAQSDTPLEKNNEKIQFLTSTGAHMNAQALSNTPKAVHFAIEAVGKQDFQGHWHRLLTMVRDSFPQLLVAHAGQVGGLGALVDALWEKLVENPDTKAIAGLRRRYF